eukprot:m.199145 g.199145  ORF g.199145 m.199145 type:complete len:594 (+) comp32724_c0_seq1:163-1944(+)
MLTPVTEQPNELTMNLGSASPIGITRLLRQVDAQMFAGWHSSPGLMDDSTTKTIAIVANIAAEVLKDPTNNLVVMAGCGTSGRMGFAVARAFNIMMERKGLAPCFRYLCAGGDAALFTSYEAPEDNVLAGRTALEATIKDKKRVLYIGITCGLSAPYIAAQLDVANRHRDVVTPVLLGFNEIEKARNVRIEGWDYTFADVIKMMQEGENPNPDFHAIVPIVGPEALTGSTRMKGGSATKIILESMLSLAYTAVHTTPTPTPAIDITYTNVRDVLREYDAAVRHTYLQADDVASMIAVAGSALRDQGRVIYVGFGAYGIASLIDASECPPTYNAGWEEIRGYLFDGYKCLRNDEGDLSKQGNQYELGPESFDKTIIATLTKNDVVIFVAGTYCNADMSPIVDRASQSKKAGAKVAIVTVNQPSAVGVAWDASVNIVLPSTSLRNLHSHQQDDPANGEGCFLADIAVKLVLNAITTGGHIIKGKILSNRMVDLQVSNNKLFYRSVGIVSKFSNKNDAHATNALLRALHQTDVVDDKIKSLDVSAHLRASTTARDAGVRVVPTAILLSAQVSLTFTQSQAILSTHPSVSEALTHLA